MRLIHVLISLAVLILVALSIYYFCFRDPPPTEVELVLDPPMAERTETEPPTPSKPTVVPPEADPKPDLREAFQEGDCQWLVRHIPDEDVAYQPGVDVDGNAVVPADLNGSYTFELPETVIAHVERRLLKHPSLRQETPFAEIEIDVRTGAIKINGKGLEGDDQDDLIAYCRDLYK